jgi:hypothetical protein
MQTRKKFLKICFFVSNELLSYHYSFALFKLEIKIFMILFKTRLMKKNFYTLKDMIFLLL